MIAHLMPLAALLPECERQLFSDAACGDPVATMAALDLVEERSLYVNPFEVGKAYYIETLTLYYVGEVVESHPTWLRMKNASWVHWTGRKSVFMKHKSFDKKLYVGCRTPRAEYVDEVCMAVGGVNVWAEWPIKNLPKESIQ